jgi:AsmA protein
MIRRILVGLCLSVLVLAGVAFALPSIMSSQTVRQEVAEQISQLTGRAVTLRGDQALKVFPNLSVELSDVVIAGDLPGTENALIITETLRGGVRALPLLLGRIELSTFELTRPTIRLLRTADGQSNWRLQGSDLVSALGPDQSTASGVQLGRFRITDGTLHFNDEQNGITETVTSADMELTWPTSSTRAAISGSAIWRGEAVELSVSLAQPAALAQPGSTSGVVLSIAGAPMRLQFDGTVSPGSLSTNEGVTPVPWQASGSVAVSTPSLRRAASWLTSEVEAGATFGAFRLDADMNMLDTTIDLTDLQLSLDGNEAEGVLTLDLDGYQNGDTNTGRPALQGTLDFARFDLSAYIDTIRPTTTAEAPGDWRFFMVPDVLASPFDLDVRFASRRVLASPLEFGETAGSVLLSADRFVLGIGEAQGYDGLVRGSLTLARDEQVQDTGLPLGVALDLSTDELDLGAFLGSFVETPALSGSLTLQTLFRGRGETIAQVLESLEGDANAQLIDGTLIGLDLNEIGESFVDTNFDLATFEMGGETELEQFSTQAFARDGYLQLRDLSVATQRLSLTMSGQSELMSRSLSFEGATAINAGGDTLVVPFDVRGTWSSPIILPDLPAQEDAQEAN